MMEALDLKPHKPNNGYYIDPSWLIDRGNSEISNSAVNQALDLLNVDQLPTEFFGCFVTRLDPFDQQKISEMMAFEEPIEIQESVSYILSPICRIAFQMIPSQCGRTAALPPLRSWSRTLSTIETSPGAASANEVAFSGCKCRTLPACNSHRAST